MQKASKLALLALACLPVAGRASEGAAWGKFIPADYPWLRWSGRAEFRGREARFDWSSVSIFAEFDGSACAVYLDPLLNNFNAFVDGELKAILGPYPKEKVPQIELWLKPLAQDPATPGPQTWIIQGLPSGHHVLELNKRTGANFSLAKFYGLRLDASATLKPPAPAPSRRIEFIGDSFTNAYGCEADSKHCAELRPYENGWKSYAAIASRGLNADFQVVALSGYGVVRNYGDKKKESSEAMPAYYSRAVSTDDVHAWDRERFQPQAVVINLGTNDFSTKPYPDEEAFVAAFVKLIEESQQGRPKTPVFVINVKGSKTQQRCLSRACEEARKRGQDAELVEFDPPGEDEMGCNWHPKAVVHERWAKRLSLAMKAHLGW